MRAYCGEILLFVIQRTINVVQLFLIQPTRHPVKTTSYFLMIVYMSMGKVIKNFLLIICFGFVALASMATTQNKMHSIPAFHLFFLNIMKLVWIMIVHI